MIWHARQSVPLVRSNPGQALMIIWAREGVFATRAQSSRASFANNNSTRGGRCHEGADIAGEH
jgi:hypothetical protein